MVVTAGEVCCFLMFGRYPVSLIPTCPFRTVPGCVSTTGLQLSNQATQLWFTHGDLWGSICGEGMTVAWKPKSKAKRWGGYAAGPWSSETIGPDRACTADLCLLAFP